MLNMVIIVYKWHEKLRMDLIAQDYDEYIDKEFLYDEQSSS